MRPQNFEFDSRKELDEESFLRSLGIDDFDIEMILREKAQTRKKLRN